MKRKSSISLGPGASSLILIFVVLALSVLGMLSLMNSRSDMRLSERSVQVAEAVYALNVRAEERRAWTEDLLDTLRQETEDADEILDRLSGALPDGMILEDDVMTWTESDGFRQLSLGLKVLPSGEGSRTWWVRYSLTSEIAEEEEW